MGKGLLLKINKMLSIKEHRKTFFKVVSAMMAVVVFCTTYALILPAMTLSKETYCGLEEHTHTEECLAVPTVVQTLVCQPEADYVLHSHDDSCYYRGELICTLPEYSAHTHTEDCYAQVRELTCGETEREEHYHTDDCYVTINTLMCNREEKEGHTHTEDCYVYTPVLVCGLEEDENHSHTEDCYTQEQELICPIAEEEGHSHTEDCYLRNTEMICGKSEGEAHSHTEDCYQTVDKLKCKELELIPHVHDESCYTDGEITCGLLQVIYHQHDQSCMGERLINTEDTAEEEIYSCNPTEGVDFVVHTHDEYCYNDAGELVCTLTERELHSHDESCYDGDGNLVCTLPEIVLHTHSEDCLVDEVLACGLPMVIEHRHSLDCVNVAAMAVKDEDEPKYVCGLEEHTHSDQCYQKPDALRFDFTVEEQGVSGYITLDWSADLPEDLECTVTVLQGYEDDYDAMYQAAADSVDTQEDQVNDITLYQIDWTSNGEAYELPEGLNPQIVLNVENSDDLGDIEHITGVVITSEETEEQSSTEEALPSAQPLPQISEIDEGEELIATDTVPESIEDGVIHATGAAAYSTYTPHLVLLSAESDGEGNYVDNEHTNNTIGKDSKLEKDTDNIYVADGPTLGGGSDDGTPSVDTAPDVEYSGSAKDADADGNIKMDLDGNIIAISKSRYFSNAGDVGYYIRIDDESQITDDGIYLFMFANGQTLMNSNSAELGAQQEAKASFDTPLKVTVHELSDTEQNKYFVFSNGAENYVNYSSGYFKYHWNMRKGTEATDITSGSYYANLYGYTFYRAYNLKDKDPNTWPLWIGWDFTSTKSNLCEYVTSIQLTRREENAWRMSFYYNPIQTYWLDYSVSDDVTEFHGTSSKEDYHYPDNILIYKYVGSSVDQFDDETQAGTKEKVEVVHEENTNTYQNDVSKTTENGLFGIDSENLPELASSVLYYASDPATSSIERNYSFYDEDPENMDEAELLEMQKANDGRVMTDKSVIYRDDDYSAFDDDDYGQGDFSVTLSAIGQEWTVKDDLDSTVPVDVMFVLDLSGSMTSKYNGVARWISSVNALNYIGKEIMNSNDQNNIGLVVFSDNAFEVLPMDHYSYTDEDYPFLWYNSSSSYPSYTLRVSSGLKGKTTRITNKDLGYTSDTTSLNYGLWQATFTQRGLEEAYNSLSRVSDTTATIKGYDENGKVVDKTVNRQPVIVLLSDGDPTLGTTDYMDPTSGTFYGNGGSRALLGYYTVLSANYFKNMVGIHYGKVADMYTIALGIEPSTAYSYYYSLYVANDYDTATAKAYAQQYYEQELYSLAVLNPTAENISKITDSSTYASFKYLLSDTGQDGTRNYTYRYYSDFGTANYNVPGIGKSNDYISARDMLTPYANYAYADGAYYGNMSTEELKLVFKSILNEVQSTVSYDFLLEPNTNVTFTDQIGNGMTVKGDPVLRYGGVNLDSAKRTKSAVLHTDDGRPYVEYSWTGTTTRRDNTTGKNVTLNLDGIKARVYQTYESDDGTVSYTNETVEFIIPEDLLPVYYPSSSRAFYYETYPVRLIYMVGLSQDELDSIGESKDEIENKEYFTSLYEYNPDEEDLPSTIVTFTPAITDPKTGEPIASAVTGEVKVNPYYTEDNLASLDIDPYKSFNHSATSDYWCYEVIQQREDSDYIDVIQYLGNNGNLTLNRPKISDITVNKEWANPGTETDSVTIRLYASGTVKKSGSIRTTNGVWCLDEKTLSASDKDSENWTALWRALPEKEIIGDYTYTYQNFYIREVSVNQKRDNVASQYTVSYKDADDKNITLTTLSLTEPNDAFKKIHPVLDSSTTVSAALANSGEVTVLNAMNFTLPDSGGMGTAPYYIGGTMLIMLGAALTLFCKAKRRKE